MPPRKRSPKCPVLAPPEDNNEEKRVEATLKFYLPDHNEEFMMASRAGEIYGILGDLLQEIRGSLKHGAPFHGMSVRDDEAAPVPGLLHNEKPMHPKVDETLEQVRKFILEALEERSIKNPW
jgi:hypothetical protein